MDIVEEHVKKCFRLSHHTFEHLNVIHNSKTLITVFWNKYQIFIYDDFNYEEEAKILEPEFHISKLILTDNYYLICLDYSGNVHIVPLKFKHSSQKRFKSCFQPREQNVVSMDCCENYTYTLKVDSNVYYICKHKNCPDFQLELQVALKLSHRYNTNIKPCLFRSYITSESEFDQIKGFFKMEMLWKHHILFLISFDRLSLYAVLFSDNITDDSVKLVKLHTSPSNITDVYVVQLDHLSIIIGLTIGTTVKVSLNTSANVDIVHLNTAVHRILAINDTMIYTDSITLWKSEKTFTKDITFKQLFVKHVKDFTFLGDKILCTTFCNLLYLFSIEASECYIKPVVDKYCPAVTVLNNSDCLDKIMGEIEKSNEIISNINEKKHFITTLALSNRQDVMDSLINYNVTVFEDFKDIEEENHLFLIDDIKEYYDTNSLYFLIKITASTLQNKFNEILSKIIGDLKIHITFKTRKNILNTVSLAFNGKMKKINLVVPLKSTTPHITLNKVFMSIRLITNIPGLFENKQCVWAILHKKNVVLNAEHFIKAYSQNSNIQPLNATEESINDLVYKTTMTQYGHLFKFNKIPKRNARVWSLYLKLPDNYEDLFIRESNLISHLNARKAEHIAKQIITKEFLKLEKELYFDIGEDKLTLQIVNDGFTKPILKTSCNNLEVTLDIKNYLTNYIYNNFKEFGPEMEFVDQAMYSTIENLEKSIRDCMKTQFSNTEEFIKLYNEYQKVVRSSLLM